MKTLFFAAFFAVASSITASAITVASPANGAKVTSPFRVVANTGVCGSVPAVSMGYSIDHGPAVIEPVAFSALVNATPGPHVLHVKCWGVKTNDQVLLNINVVQRSGNTSGAAGIVVTAPASGAQLASPFRVVAGTNTCGSVPAVSMGYSMDSGRAVIEPVGFSAMVSAAPGPHVLHVKCWGVGTGDQVLLNINVTQGGGGSTNISVASPANNAQVSSPFSLAASVSSCNSAAPTSVGYSVDGGHSIAEPAYFATAVTANPGWHSLTISCSGRNGSGQTVVRVRVIPASSAAMPVFSLAGGKYATRQVVSLADATPGAAIHYTIDGTTPGPQSPQYAAPLSIASSTVVRALAVAQGYTNSNIASAAYTIGGASGPVIPPNATKLSQVQLMPDWRIKHDPATGGAASGAMSVVNYPSLSGQADRFVTSFTNWGGVLYSLTYGNDTTSHNFVYDAEVWIDAGSAVGNLEMDNNQVTADGSTYIYAFQCAGDSGVWEYSENAGTASKPVVKWMPSNAPCNPESWTPNAWHHVQVSYSRDDAGHVTFHSVWLDGAEQKIDKTVNAAFSLGWAKGALVTNFQVDGKGVSGGSSLYLDQLTIYRW